MGWWERIGRVAGARGGSGGRGRGGPIPPGTPLADLAAAPWVPGDTPLEQVELLAIDLETTGLDPRRDELLSFGFVLVRGGQVHLGTARHLPVRPRGQVGDSAVLHGLTDDTLAAAPPVAQVLPEVLRALVSDGPGPDVRAPEAAAPHAPPGSVPPRRRVLLAHFAQVETAFLAAACRETYGAVVDLQVVDTLQLARRLLRAQPHELQAGAVRLDACRRRHGLPRYGAHNAVTDAIACAELFLAQTSELARSGGRALTLADVVGRTR